MSSLLRLGEGRIIRLRVIQDTKVTPLPCWKSATICRPFDLRQQEGIIEIMKPDPLPTPDEVDAALR